MRLCSSGHDEVCFESRFCPCCTFISEIAGKDARIDNLEDDTRTLNIEVEALQIQIGVLEGRPT